MAAEQVHAGLLGPHNQIVDDLVGRLDAIAQGDLSVPRVVVLRGESGYGKSRIVREFYDRLRSRQPEPGFWPPLPARHVDDDGIPVPLGERKVIGPPLNDFVWPPEALPSFGWWAFHCERATGRRAMNILAEAREQFTVWLPPFTEAWAKRAGLWKRLTSKRKDIARMLRDAAAGELADAGIDQLQQALNIAVPGIGTIAGWTWQGALAGKRRHEAYRDLTSAVDLGQRATTERQSAAEQLAAGISNLTLPDLPGVVVVEDAHLATVELAELFTTMSWRQADRPVLLVLTAWPEGELHGTWDGWLAEARRWERADVVAVPRLDQSDLITLTRRYAPLIDDRGAAQLTASMPSPLLLELWLTLESTQRRIRKQQGALAVDDGLLAKLPTSLADVYRDRWRELTPQVRQALTIAVALCSPDDAAPAFLPEIIAGAAAALDDFVDAEELTEGLALAADPAAWTVIVDEIEAFREAPLATQARNAVEMDEGTRSELVTAAIAQLRAWIDEGMQPDYWLASAPKTDLAADWLLDLTGGEAIEEAADVAAHWLHARNLADRQQPREAIALVTPCSAVVPPAMEDALLIREDIAGWTGMAGDYREAAKLYDELVRDLDAHQSGDEHWLVYRAKDYLAYFTGQAGHYSQAIALYSDLIPTLTEARGASHPSTLSARESHAVFTGQAGRYEQAITLYDDLIPTLTETLGDTHPDTLQARGNHAVFTGQAGRYEQAITLYDDLIPTLTETLGDTHPSTLQARGNHAVFTGQAGRYEQAIVFYDDLIPTLTETLGDTHPDTLQARSNHAFFTGQAGRYEQAIVFYDDLIPTLTETLGDTHPDTLQARSNHAFFTGQAGRYEQAIVFYDDLIPTLTETLGDTHPDSLATRSNHALFAGHAGRYEQAIVLYDDLIPTLTETLGDTHPNTLQARSNHAFFAGHAGRYEQAIVLYDDLIPTLTETLGDTHPNTLQARGNHAGFTGHAGHHTRALLLLTEVIPALSSSLGAHHPTTLDALFVRALVTGLAGRQSEAVKDLTELAAVVAATFGADHPFALGVRRIRERFQAELAEARRSAVVEQARDARPKRRA